MKLKSIASLRFSQRVAFIIALAICFVCMNGIARAQSSADEDEPKASTQNSAAIARRLSSLDPIERQQAAEELARLAARDQQQLVAGYRLEEKNARVRLALDWALYRMGKNEALFNIVRDLDSSRQKQASEYLAQLETPEPLYVFLQRANGNTQARLLPVLAHIGNEETLERIKPYTSSYDPKIAEAAKDAAREISRRLAESPTASPARQRKTGNVSESP